MTEHNKLEEALRFAIDTLEWIYMSDGLHRDEIAFSIAYFRNVLEAYNKGKSGD